MARTHIVQSWVGACEYDDGDTYSGEQIGNRLQKSIGVTIQRSGDQYKVEAQQPPVWVSGRANVSAFTDDKPDRQAKPKPGEIVISWQDPLDAIQKPKGYKVRPGELYLERLDALELSLYKQYKSGLIKEKEWQAERQAIASRRQREWAIFENSGFAPVDI